MSFSKRVAAGPLVLLLVLGACGGSGSDAAASRAAGRRAVLASSDATRKAGSSKVVMSADVDLGGGKKLSMTGEGAFNYPRQVGQMTFKLSGQDIPEAFGSYDIRFVEDVLYMRFPPEFRRLTGGRLKTWIRIDVSEFVAQQGFGGFPGFSSLTSQDPTSTLAFVRGAKEVRKVADEQIRGEETTHYTLVVDLEKAVESMPEAQRAGIRELIDKAHLRELPMDLWVDAQNRARRMKFALDVSKVTPSAGPTPTGGPSSVAILIDLFEFGAPVNVTAPPARDVSDYAELKKLSSSG